MSIFDFLKDLLFFKSKRSLSNIDSESSFSPYMVNRWASMYSNTVALYSNILNKYLMFSPNKEDLFGLFLAVLPRVPQRKITYYKKNKEEKSDNDENIVLLAKSLELSTKEIEKYIDTLKCNK